jgi:hypothetical protein
VVEKGEYKVILNGRDEVAELGIGAAFGELALM